MRLRWLLALLLGIALVRQQAPAKAQQQPASEPIRLLEQTDTGLTVAFAASFSNFQQSPAYAELLAPVKSDSTRQVVLPGSLSFPLVSALIGLPPEGTVELQILADDAFALTDPRLLAAAANHAGDLSQIGPAVRLVDEAWVRDRRVARLEFRPFQAQSGGQPARWHQNLQVALRFSNTTLPVSTAPVPGEDAAVLGQLLNARQARTWRVTPAALPAGAVREPFADAPNTPLGPRYKIVVDADGLYQLTASSLQTAGLNLAGVDPRSIHLSCQGLDVPVYIQGEGDGSFDAGDVLLFYGQKFRGERLAARHPEETSYYSAFSNGWHPQFNAVQAEKYTAENIYWLTVEATPGLRAATQTLLPPSAAAANSTRETVHLEQSVWHWTWHFTGEDTWFWDRLTDSLDHSYVLDLPAPDLASIHDLRISGEMVAFVSNPNYNPDHHTKILFNSALVENLTWDGPTRHHFSGLVPASALAASNTLHIQAIWDAYTGQTSDDIFLDWVEVEYDRGLTAQGDVLAFQSAAPARRYQVAGFTSPQVEVWDISLPGQPLRLSGFSNTAGTLDFETASGASQKYIAAGSSAWQNPKRIEYYNPPELLAAGADYVIITHASFVAAAQRLADLRAAQGLRVRVIDFADLVNQFNDGIYHPIAIKNFLAYTFLHWQAPAPASVVLVGDGHWNLRGFNPARYGSAPVYLPPNLAWVDYPDISTLNQGEVDSANLLANVVGQDPLPDLAIGRIPVNSVAELNAVIDKIAAYEAAPANQDWQKRFFFIADNVPDPAGDFQVLSNAIIRDYLKTPYQSMTAYLAGDAAAQVTAQRTAILNGFNLGALVTSYVGHGAIKGWTGGFDTSNIASLANGTRLPFVLSMTCSDGYWIVPPTYLGPFGSFAEEMLRAPNKGAVATFSPSGYGNVYGHDLLQRGLMTALLKNFVSNTGALSTAARLKVYASNSHLELIHQFILFGDPALNLKLPFNRIFMPAIQR